MPPEDEVLGYLDAGDFSALAEICAAVDTAKSRRDRILVDLNWRSPKGLREMTSLRELFG